MSLAEAAKNAGRSFRESWQSRAAPRQPRPPPGQRAVPLHYAFWVIVPAADAPALTAVITTVTGPLRTHGPPTTSAGTTALTIGAAGDTWALAGFAT
jgi:hypothetical protein